MKNNSIRKVSAAYGISEYQLENGLRILYRYEPAAPVVAINITFHVGSRNEAPGHTGSTHILEHLLFKDSKDFNRANGKSPTYYLERFGAILNASTWFDRTNYYELMPREHVYEALSLEADRMRNSLFSADDLATEMTVVRNEYERYKNDPFGLLDEAIMETAFIKHPYHIPTIGSKEDIEGSTVERLRKFYNTFYWPNNATLTVIGDIVWKDLRGMLQRTLGVVPSSPHTIPHMRIKEPVQREARSCRIDTPHGISIAALAFKIPSGRDTDYPALLLLTTILANGFSSRLRRTLVDAGLAADVYGNAPSMFDPGLSMFMAQTAHGTHPETLLTRMQEEIYACVKTLAEPEELQRAKERILSNLAIERDGPLSEANTLSEAVASGDWTLAYRIESAILKLKPIDLMRVAKKYFVPTRETSGILHHEK